MDINYLRFIRLIDAFIKKTTLDLTNLCVLTEAATGHYWVTPIIAAKSGANVIAFAKDTIYASANESISFVKSFASKYNVLDKIEFTTKLASDIINQADIITNSMTLRPIDKKFIQSIKKTAVIPLMYEAWEFRKSDIDLNECINNEILVLGVNENSELLPIFENVQMLIIKILFENNLEVFNNRFILVSEDKFGDHFESILKKCKAEVFRGSPFVINQNINNFNNIDAIIIAEYSNHETIISEMGVIETEKIKRNLPDTTIINFSGNIDYESLKKFEIPFFPKENVGNYKMAKTFTYLGIKPVLELIGAGLKVGEIMHKNRLKYSYLDAKAKSLKNILCQDIITTNNR